MKTAFADSPFYVALLIARDANHAKAKAVAQSWNSKEWSLTDCISFLVMEERGLREALAADHHFEQAGFIMLLSS